MASAAIGGASDQNRGEFSSAPVWLQTQRTTRPRPLWSGLVVGPEPMDPAPSRLQSWESHRGPPPHPPKHTAGASFPFLCLCFAGPTGQPRRPPACRAPRSAPPACRAPSGRVMFVSGPVPNRQPRTPAPRRRTRPGGHGCRQPSHPRLVTVRGRLSIMKNEAHLCPPRPPTLSAGAPSPETRVPSACESAQRSSVRYEASSSPTALPGGVQRGGGLLTD